MSTPLLILANPYNLVAFYFALGGFAIWGVGDNYILDFSLLSLFKVFGIPTLIFAAVWMLLTLWKKLSNLKLYAASSVLSFLIIIVCAKLYWLVVGRQ